MLSHSRKQPSGARAFWSVLNSFWNTLLISRRVFTSLFFLFALSNLSYLCGPRPGIILNKGSTIHFYWLKRNLAAVDLKGIINNYLFIFYTFDFVKQQLFNYWDVDFKKILHISTFPYLMGTLKSLLSCYQITNDKKICFYKENNTFWNMYLVPFRKNCNYKCIVKRLPYLLEEFGHLLI